MDAINSATAARLAVAAAVAAATYAAYKLLRAGLFAPIRFSHPVKVPLSADAPAQDPSVAARTALVFKTRRGRYRDCGEVFDEMFSILRGHVREDGAGSRYLGIYWDDPQEAGEDNCRYTVGILLDTAMEESKEAIRLLKERGSFVCNEGGLPQEMEAMHTDFPFTGLLSVLISIWRVYPAAEKYCKQQGVPQSHDGCCVIEITMPMHMKRTHFYFLNKAAPQAFRSQLLAGLL